MIDDSAAAQRRTQSEDRRRAMMLRHRARVLDEERAGGDVVSVGVPGERDATLHRHGELEDGPAGEALSGGQRRRLSVAQGLLRRADVLLLDEPTEALDTPTAARLLAGVRAFDPDAGS